MRLLTALALAGLLGLPTTGAAQQRESATGCVTADLARLSVPQRVLVKRASLDPIIGCAVMDAQHRVGDTSVGTRDTIRGNLVVIDGTLHVAGTITGSAIVLNGAAIIDASGHVTGDVIAAERGATIAPAGRIDGELRIVDDVQAPLLPLTATAGSTFSSLKRTAIWFGILLVIGVGVLTNAGDSLQRITTALNDGFGRNVLVGFLAQVALLPVLAIICLLLTLTLLGILLVPFAIVAYVIAVLGVVVLGLLGAAQMVGRGTIRAGSGLTDRGIRLQAMIAGLVLLGIPWLVAAAVSTWPIASFALHTAALGITWVAVTAGFGAALRTRGGTRPHTDPWGIRRPAPSGAPLPEEPKAPQWLTPTPITGVVAVKRPRAGSGSAR